MYMQTVSTGTLRCSGRDYCRRSPIGSGMQQGFPWNRACCKGLRMLQTNWSDKLHSMRSLWFLSPNLGAISADSCVSVPSEADEFGELESEVIDTMPITMRVPARTAKIARVGFIASFRGRSF